MGGTVIQLVATRLEVKPIFYDDHLILREGETPWKWTARVSFGDYCIVFEGQTESAVWSLVWSMESSQYVDIPDAVLDMATGVAA